MAATAVGLVVLWLIGTPRHKRIGFMLTAGLLGALSLVLAGGTILDFVGRGQDSQLLTSLSGRTVLFEEAWSMLRESPLIGFGFFAGRGLYIDSVGLAGSHNLLVELLTSGGIVGTGLYVALIVVLVGGLSKLPRVGVGAHTSAFGLGFIAFILVEGIANGAAAGVPGMQTVWLVVVASWVAIASQSPTAAGLASRVGR